MSDDEIIRFDSGPVTVTHVENLSRNALAEKAQALVDLLDDAERNHGSLVGTLTMRARDELRLELSKWK